MRTAIVIFIVALGVSACSFAESPPDVFASVCHEVKEGKPLSLEYLNDLETIWASETNALDDRLTARVLSTITLSSHDNPERTKQSITICDQVIGGHSDTWQADFLRYARVANYGLLAEYETQVNMANEAISVIDFSRLDSGIRSLPKDCVDVMHVSAEVFRDTLVGMLSYASRVRGDFEAALKICDDIKDPELKQQHLTQISLAEEVRTRHLERAVNQAAKTAQQGEPERTLHLIVEYLNAGGNRHSTTAVHNLEILLESGVEEIEELSAKVLLAFFLADKVGSTQETNTSGRIRDLCAAVADEAPDSWQGAVAQVLLANERGFAGDYESQVALASNALDSIDFQSLEAEQDPTLAAIRHALGDKPFIFREVLKYTLAGALARTDRPAEAEQIRQTITDAEFKSAAEKQLARMESIKQRIRARDSGENPEANPPSKRNDRESASSPSGTP